MHIDFFLGYLIPSLVGIFITLLCRRDCHDPVKSAIFLVSQILILRYFGGGTPYSAQFVVLAILSGYVGFTFWAKASHKIFLRYIGVVFFLLYLGYWAFEKYFLPLGWSTFALKGMQNMALVAPSEIAENITEFASAIQEFIIHPPVVMFGISYIGFKLIHFFVDYRADEIKKPTLLEFLNWLFFFPSIIAGPMIRFQDWNEQREKNVLNKVEIATGVRRIVLGLFMKLVIADNIHGLTIAALTPGAASSITLWQLALMACFYTIYIYFDFAGYSHIAIGLGHFWGIRLPENFNAPYKARNLAEFWNRWHMSLSLILRDYLYYPVSLYLKRIPQLRKHPVVTTIIPPFVTFLLAGIWHGAGLGFVIFGALHGIGLSYLAVAKRYKRTSPFAQWWANSPFAHVCSTLITFFYVSFAFIFFCLPIDKLSMIWNTLTQTSS
jgi:alginate O-acetyltransferase complex protein AlgI